MRFVRGNDIKIVWSINKLVDGILVPEDLTLVLDLNLFISRNGVIMRIDDYTIIGADKNQLSFTVKGKNLKTGMYNLEATYFKEYDARITKSNAFMIVDDSSQLNYDSPFDVQGSSVEFKTGLIINGIFYTLDDLKALIQSIVSTN